MTRHSPPLPSLWPLMSALFSLSPRLPLPPFHSFMLRGCQSSIRVTNGTRKTLSECIVVHPQLLPYFFWKHLNLEFSLGGPLNQQSTLFVLLLLSWDYKHIGFMNLYREKFPCYCLHATVLFLIVLKGSSLSSSVVQVGGCFHLDLFWSLDL